MRSKIQIEDISDHVTVPVELYNCIFSEKGFEEELRDKLSRWTFKPASWFAAHRLTNNPACILSPHPTQPFNN